MLNKNELRKTFSKDWEKHYKLNVLIEHGFKRRKCKVCGRYFWSIEDTDVCGDPACSGYKFINNPPSNLKLGYIETWKRIEKYFNKRGHKSIKSYPTVARWRDDLYFTIASINDFQPYVVNGELEPLANPLIVPQLCIRFSDVDNVGLTGRHYTNFVMIGQHAFNTEKTGLFYWKEEAISHDINYLKDAIGIDLEKIKFHEDVWVGGGNFGPSMEYFVDGLELGNCVFMQYEQLPNGNTRELKTRVIDMGAGLSRLAWITHGAPESYSIVYPEVVNYLMKHNGITYDKALYNKFAMHSGMLNADEVDLEKAKQEVAKALSMDKKELFDIIYPLQAIFSIADHSMTLLQTITDGMMPSNSGGGYNLRMIARRMFGFEEELNLDIDYYKILQMHASQMKEFGKRYYENVESVYNVIEHEKKKYKESKQKAEKKIIRILSKNRSIDKETLIKLYKSDGITPQTLKKEAKKKGVEVHIPDNFYSLIKEDVEQKKQKIMHLNKDYPQTEKLYYENIKSFKAKILGIEGNYVILDRTAFYPEGGGQAGDTGLINGVRVIDTKKINNVIIHIVDDPNGLSIGQEVEGIIDWGRRLQITKNHTATHLITASARKVLGNHVWQAGAKKDDKKAHIDLTHYKKITDEELKQIEMLANKYIMQNLPIIIEILPRNIAESRYGFSIYQGGAVPGKYLRIVKIGDIDVEACGGTHNLLKGTGEIGLIKIIKRESIKDGVERITFTTAERAIEYIQQEEEIIKKVGAIFKVDKAHLITVSKRFFEEWKEKGKLIEKLLGIIKKQSEGKIIELPLTIKQFGIMNTNKPTLVMLNDGIIICSSIDKAKAIQEALGIKGGGNKNFYILKGAYDKNKVLELWES